MKNGSKERISFETTRTVEAVTSVSDFLQKRTCYQLLLLFSKDCRWTKTQLLPPPDVSSTISVVVDFIYLIGIYVPFNQHVFLDRLTPTPYTALQRMLKKLYNGRSWKSKKNYFSEAYRVPGGRISLQEMGYCLCILGRLLMLLLFKKEKSWVENLWLEIETNSKPHCELLPPRRHWLQSITEGSPIENLHRKLIPASSNIRAEERKKKQSNTSF